MRTIKKTALSKMVLQAEEAQIQGLTKVADSLTEQIEHYSDHIRSDDEFYLYASSDFQKDVEKTMWDLVVRTADFHDLNFDAAEMQDLVESFASEIISELRNKLGAKHGVGAYEPTVPGEALERTVLEVE